MKAFKILGIETSCDETSIAILSVRGNDVRILHHETSTQIPIHQRYGGVVPEVAARTHVAEILTLLDRAKVFPKPKVDAVAVTRGPGLATALRVGIESARTIAAVTGIPTVGVNHLEGHLASAWLVAENRKHWKFPILALLVSGGHTEIVLMKDFCSYKILGRTRDDAAGEAFDKTSKLMGLGYPGGPAIAERAMKGDPTTFVLPRPMLHEKSFDFSFSGLKTAVRNTWEKLPPKKRKDAQVVSDLCASVQAAIVDVLVAKTLAAARKVRPNAICIVGGVSANRRLHEAMSQTVTREFSGVRVLEPAKGLHTDNAAMIAAAGAWRFQRGKLDTWQTLDANPELDI
ncbi:MAG: tRNA (adenosine(37)-N6)-threonylcarbamoyltransferase complex transferase subunit TsaD [Patescibacteria group bacterium]